MIKNLINKLIDFLEYVGRAKAAASLSRIGEYQQAQEIMKK